MADAEMTSLTVTIIQWTATVLVAFLLCVLVRSTRRSFLYYWAWSWGCLSMALLALSVAFQAPAYAGWLYALYFFFEYAWGYLLLAGCLNLTRGARLGDQRFVPAAVGLIVALVLAQLPASFNFLFAFHALIITGFIAASAYVVLRRKARTEHGTGIWLMGGALVSLTLVFAHYVPFCAYSAFTGQPYLFPHLEYSAVYDMLLELLLAFGMVMVAMDSVRREVEKVNYDLAAASLRLQVLAQEDSLTAAYNRHAFYTFTERGQPGRQELLSGCVAVLDLNDLKRINDTLGHQAGDGALRIVAGALRSVIRADDLLFRWGGDEFLILWPHMAEHDARKRLDRLNPLLKETLLPGYSLPVHLTVSYGVAAISGAASLEQAIHEADSEMYACKQLHKQRQYAERRDTATKHFTPLVTARP